MEILWDDEAEAAEKPPETLKAPKHHPRGADMMPGSEVEEVEAEICDDFRGNIHQRREFTSEGLHPSGHRVRGNKTTVREKVKSALRDPGTSGAHYPEETIAKAFGMYCAGASYEAIGKACGMTYSAINERVTNGRWPELRELERNQRLADNPRMLRIAEATRLAMKEIQKQAREDPQSLVPGLADQIEKMKAEHLEWLDEQLSSAKENLELDEMSRKFLATKLGNITAIDKLARKRLDMDGGGPRNVLLAQHLNVSL